MIFLRYFFITVIIGIIGSYIATMVALSGFLSNANIVWATIVGLIAGGILYMPILIILLINKKGWGQLILAEAFGFFIILYLVYSLVKTIASV